MQIAEWTFEYSAFEYYKQQKHRGYVVIQGEKEMQITAVIH